MTFDVYSKVEMDKGGVQTKSRTINERGECPYIFK